MVFGSSRISESWVVKSTTFAVVVDSRSRGPSETGSPRRGLSFCNTNGFAVFTTRKRLFCTYGRNIFSICFGTDID